MLTRLQVASDKHSWLLGRAQHLCGTRADAEDLVQETFLRLTAMFSEDSEIPESWPSASWLLSTMTHCYYDQCRRRRVRERCAADPLLCLGVQEAPDSPPAAASELVSSEELDQAVQRLSANARNAMSLHLRGRKIQEIALELGVSYGAVAKRLYDGRIQLRRLLQMN
jgi:RNA polymerase sigma-70 factor (ECF subfamily)